MLTSLKKHWYISFALILFIISIILLISFYLNVQSLPESGVYI